MNDNFRFREMGFCISDWWLVIPQSITKDYPVYEYFINAIQDPDHEIYRQYYYFYKVNEHE